MRHDGSPFEEDAQSRPPSEEADQDLAIREPYLRRVLAEFEAGHLEAYDYTQCVRAIIAATSTQEMAAIVDAVPDGLAGGADPTLHRGLDVVDLALLRSPRLSEAGAPTTRYVTLAVVFLLFAVLIGIGMWLATHVHGAALTPGAEVGSRLALVTSGWC